MIMKNGKKIIKKIVKVIKIILLIVILAIIGIICHNQYLLYDGDIDKSGYMSKEEIIELTNLKNLLKKHFIEQF